MSDFITNTTIGAMKRGVTIAVLAEVTIAVLADLSKAFDTVSYSSILGKLHSQGFSKEYLKWFTSHLTGRRQFVQIDDVNFVLEFHKGIYLVLFSSTYMSLISLKTLTTICSHQYADHTTIYAHCKPADIKSCEEKIQSNKLSTWSSSNNLVLNPNRTKVMLFLTSQLSCVHQLDEDRSVHLHVNGIELKITKCAALLRTTLHQNLKWNDNVNKKISSCYASLSVLRKLKHLAPLKIRKQIAECLVLSKIYYNECSLLLLALYLIGTLD